MAIIELIKKDGSKIFKEGDLSGGAIYARTWNLTDKNTILTCKAGYHVVDIDTATNKPKKDPNTGKEKKKFVQEELIYHIEKELILLTIEGAKIFPKPKQEDEDVF